MKHILDLRKIVFAFGSFATQLIEVSALATPQQPPVREFSLESCRPYYSASDFAAMSTVTEIREAREKFPASYMFVPTDGAQHPGVLWLHGSEGGRWAEGSMCQARYLAAHGYAALFFCYSDCGLYSLPETITAVDLRRTYEAMVWLKESPHVGGKKIALTGGSRGGEQALVLASFLADRVRSTPDLIVPDAIFAHAPYGKIVGAFNWRFFYPSAGEWRWNAALKANMSCLLDDPLGPYTYVSPTGEQVRLSWKSGDPACADKPALSMDDCWIRDPNGPYSNSQGEHFTWVEPICGPPSRQPDWATWNSAWSWEGKVDVFSPQTDIKLDLYQGDVLISQGSLDEVWNINYGLKYLAARLDLKNIPYHLEVIPVLTTTPSPMPTVSTERVLFEVFEGEGHGYSMLATEVERKLALSFFRRLDN